MRSLLVYLFRHWLPVFWPVPPVMPMTESRELSRTECRCDKRREAQSGGAFLYWPPHRAWIFPDLVRWMSPHARYYALVDRAEFKHEDHTGECYRFTCCPYCGHCLPHCSAPQIMWPQADGSEGPE